MRDLNITLLQADLHWHNPAANRAMFEPLIKACAGNSDLVVLPETFSTGFTMDAADNSETMDGESTTWLQQLAVEHNIALCGGLIVRDEQQCYNRFICALPDGTLQHYDKRHLFHMVGEDRQFAPGQQRLIIELAGWRICPLICYDLRFPVWSRSKNDYDLLLYIANWPEARKTAWETLLPARAVENLSYVAGVNRVGTDGKGIAYAGGSTVADYLGNRLAVAGTGPEALRISLSMEKLQRYREKFSAWKDADDFQVLNT